MHRSIYLLSAGMFALGLDAYVVAGLLPGIADTYRVSVAAAGMTVAVFTIFYALSAPMFATMLAGRPGRLVLSIALLIFILANVASALSPTFEWLLASRAIAGAGAGIYSPLAAASAASLAGKERQGSVLGFILGGMSLGTVAGVPVGLFIAHHIGWQGALWAVAGLGVIALIGIRAFFPAITPVSPPSIRERLMMMRDGDVVKTIGVTFLISVASLGLYTYVAPILSEAMLQPYLPFLLCVWGIGGIVGSFTIGRIIDWVHHKQRIIGFIAISLTGVFAVLPVTLGHLMVAIVPFFLWGALGWASQAPQQHSLLVAHPKHGPAAVALNSSANYLGSATGAFLGSLFLDAGQPPHFLPLAAAVTVAVAFAISALSVRNFAGTRSFLEGERR